MHKTVYYSTQPGTQRAVAPPYMAAPQRTAMPQGGPVPQGAGAPKRPVAAQAPGRAPLAGGAARQPRAAAAVRPVRAPRGAKSAPLVLAGCLALALLAVLLVPLMVGGASAPASQAMLTAQPAQRTVTASYDTVQQAAQGLNIAPAMPAALPQGYAATSISVVDGQVIEVVYANGRDKVVLLTAAGSDDLSGGALNNYLYTATETAGGIARSYAGVSDKKLNLAVWATGGYSYAITAEDGLAAEEMRRMAESIE